MDKEEQTQRFSMDDLNKNTEAIIGAAIEVHEHFGPGLLESAYRECLRYELLERRYIVFYEPRGKNSPPFFLRPSYADCRP